MFVQEFRHDTDRRFAADYDHENDDNGEFDEIVTEGKGFIESNSSELLYRKVKSDEEACELYNSYAFKHGFGTRKGVLKTREDRKTIRQRRLYCSYAGFKKVKSDVVYQKRDFPTGCKAFIQFDVDKYTGLYIVVKHEMEHNHTRVPISKRHLIRSRRKISDDQLAMISSLSENGIPVVDAYRVLKNQAGGEANLGFLQRYLYVVLSGEKKKKFDGCDTQQLICYFKERKLKECDFYYDFDVDEKGHLQSFFFHDSRMKVDYDAFGDLLVYGNKYI